MKNKDKDIQKFIKKSEEITRDEYDYFFGGGVYSESDVILKSTNKYDFENLKDDLKLGKTLNIRPIDVTTENIEKIAEASKLFNTNRDGRAPLDRFKLAFLDEEKSNFQIFGAGVEEATLKSLHLGGLTLDEDKFEIKMKIEHYSYDPVTKKKNDYVKDTIKDLAKKNNSELEFEYRLGSEEIHYKFKDATIYNEKENFDIQGNSKYYSIKYHSDTTGKIIEDKKAFGRDSEITQDKSTIKNIVEKIKAPFKLKVKQQSKSKDMER
ncbi:hypothetical protein ACNSOL_10905 [Aliarcobacter lanthieri]|uniref:hypothetical protein n=1 Tax=Aliarcobacter lanthieri TaxID=1355374 RepID=UPI003AAA908A